MNYGIIKLNFQTAVHFGNDLGTSTLTSTGITLHSDTIFSALFIESLISFEEKKSKWLIETFQKGDLLISDAMPYSGEELFVNKPIISIDSKEKQEISQRKQFKKLRYLPITKFGKYVEYMRGETKFEAEPINLVLKNLGNESVRCVAAVRTDSGESRPYYVGTYKFNCESGLYIVVGYKREQDFDILAKLFEILGLSGIGGKRSSGLGKFCINTVKNLNNSNMKNCKCLNEMLMNKTANYNMTISTCIAESKNLDTVVKDSFFTMIRRGGFVQSETYNKVQSKKATTYCFGSGSCFKHEFEGSILDVGIEGTHPVYRYAKPMFMGVSI